MKALFILLIINLSLMAKWSFNQKDFEQLTPSQLEVINIHYLTGEEKGVGLRLAAITVVETQAGKIDFNDNHICGAAQLNINLLDNVSCEMLESNHYLSALYARENLLSWIDGMTKNLVPFKRTLNKATKMYCVGYTNHPHQDIYLNRVLQVEKIFRKNGYK